MQTRVCPTDGPTAEVLQVVELPLVNLTVCKELIRFLVEDTNLCAGYMEGGKDACTVSEHLLIMGLPFISATEAAKQS